MERTAARDCLFIGKHAFNKGLYDQAVQWLQTALELSKLEADGPTKPREVLPFLNTAIRVHDDILEKKGPFGKDWKTLAEHINPRRLERIRKRQNQPGNNGAVNTDALGLATMATPAHEELEVFFKLCRGEKLRVSHTLTDFCHRTISKVNSSAFVFCLLFAVGQRGEEIEMPIRPSGSRLLQASSAEIRGNVTRTVHRRLARIHERRRNGNVQVAGLGATGQI